MSQSYVSEGKRWFVSTDSLSRLRDFIENGRSKLYSDSTIQRSNYMRYIARSNTISKLHQVMYFSIRRKERDNALFFRFSLRKLILIISARFLSRKLMLFKDIPHGTSFSRDFRYVNSSLLGIFRKNPPPRDLRYINSFDLKILLDFSYINSSFLRTFHVKLRHFHCVNCLLRTFPVKILLRAIFLI